MGHTPMRDQCWICDHWREVKFTWSPGISSPDACEADSPIFVCPEYNEYNPIYLGTQNSKSNFDISLMAP